MSARHRTTDAIQTRLESARRSLADSRRLIDRGMPIVALWRIMHALLQLQRVRERIDGFADRPSNPAPTA